MKQTISNIIYCLFMGVVLLQCVLITRRLAGIFANMTDSPSGPFLFFLMGTVIFQCVVNVVLSLLFRSNTWLGRKITLRISKFFIIYQALLAAGLIAAVMLMVV